MIVDLNKIENEKLREQSNEICSIAVEEGIVILCQNEYARSLISKKYEENPINYYEAYLEHINDDMVFRKSMLDIEEENAYNQLIGIIAYDTLLNGKDNFVYELYKKCYKWLYRHIQSSYSCDVIDILNRYSKKYKGGFLNRRNGIEIAIVSVQIAAHLDKPLVMSSLDVLEDLTSSSKLAMNTASGDYFELNKLNRLYDTFPKECLSVKNFPTVGQVVRYISDDNMEIPIMADSMMYFINYLRAIGVDDYSMGNVPYTEEDIKIMTNFLNFDKGYILSDDSKKVIVSALYMLLAMKKKYFIAKDFALNKSAEREYKNIIESKQAFEKKENDYLEKIASLERQLEKMKSDNETLSNSNDSLIKENKKLKSKIDTIEDHSKEVVALRREIYSFNQEDDFVEDAVSYEDKIEKIRRFKITIFGGAENWVNYMKEDIPNVRFIRDDLKNSDISFIKNDDYVFINIKDLSHAFYYKIMNIVRNSDNIKLGYLRGGNKAINIDRIYSILNEK